MKIAALKPVAQDNNVVVNIPMQPASLDIWDKKYRLKAKNGRAIDETVDSTYQRVARALAEVEQTPGKREQWCEKFLWALRHGAIPAGRIISNAGAREHKPATSTINCTVSGTIGDSMDDILQKVHEAGLTLKSGAGIGYEFSTLRPRGAYVSGAGAYTSGPLSFMDIYDKMCFTVSSAGGRRGAQMATFDVGHPDVMDFIRAKREAGRLRQFNLSLLVSDEFMRAVNSDADWALAFPLLEKEVSDDIDLDDPEEIVWREWPNKEGLIIDAEGRAACKVYKKIRARRLWDMIMASTYDYAEPGFILIDRYNEMNNNWFCENIRATNPCVTGDTWVQTSLGPRQVRDLIGKPFLARLDDRDHMSGPDGFFRTASKQVLRLRTAEGYQLRLTADHRVRRVTRFTRDSTETEWCAAAELRTGDRVLLNDHSKNPAWQGSYTFDEGYGLSSADGVIQQGGKAVANSDIGGIDGSEGAFGAALNVERTSSDFHRGFLCGIFDTGGSVQVSREQGISVRLVQSDLTRLQTAQRMLLRLGIASKIYRNNRPQPELVISGANLMVFAETIGFSHTGKRKKLEHALSTRDYSLNRERYTAVVTELTPDGIEDVYDVQVPGINAFDANGLHAHNCGEQGLPPYGSCLLGSVNLTKYVQNPFTGQASFDWDAYREVVAIFTRMLDNVVEINGLPLAQQRDEITNKRRHGMGYLGLGSTLTMLGMKYGSPESLEFTGKVTKEMALTGWRVAVDLAKEKGPAPILERDFTVTTEMLEKRPEMAEDGYQEGDTVKGRVLHARYSRYLQRVAEADPALVEELAATGARFTHHTSIAPTGTISLSLANNASNGIEPSFAHHYSRNVIREGKKSKEKIDVFSFELLAYRELINPEAMPHSNRPEEKLPDYFFAADDINPKEHVDIQAAAQKWIDSSISKTANVPTDFPYEDFKDIYMYAYEQGLKGCTTFRFNPEAFQGVLVKEEDLENTTYRFTLEDGNVVELKGNEEVEYDGESHTAANLFDALKEGYYGKF